MLIAFLTLRLLVLSGDCETVQISAVDCDGLRRFDPYLYLNRNISFGATKVTGIAKSSGKLFCHGMLLK